jgi:hypothetical protein
MKPNKATAPNAAMTLRFQIERDARGIGESRRSASVIGCPRLPPQCQSRSAMSAMSSPAGFRRHGGRCALRGGSRDLSPMPNKGAAANRRERFQCYAGVQAAVAELSR